jgi:hypothetical protein
MTASPTTMAATMAEFTRASYARFAPWAPSSGPCAPVAPAGSRALMAAILLRWAGKARNWGMLSCRDTALGGPSKHRKGEALDVGCSLRVGRNIRKRLMRVGPERLGISCIIHDRVIYSAKSPGGRHYPGHPHHDHVHIELTPRAARRLNLTTVARILNS